MIACLVFGYVVSLVICALAHQKLKQIQGQRGHMDHREREIAEYMQGWRAFGWVSSIALTFLGLALASGWGFLLMAPVAGIWIAATVWMFFIDTVENNR